MDNDYLKLQNSLITIASELLRFQHVFEKVVSKLPLDDQTKYMSQYNWFTQKVINSLNSANLKLINLEGQVYDPGMAVTPLNIDDFEPDDPLYITQMIEPIIMQNDIVLKTGTVIVGRVE